MNFPIHPEYLLEAKKVFEAYQYSAISVQVTMNDGVTKDPKTVEFISDDFCKIDEQIYFMVIRPETYVYDGYTICPCFNVWLVRTELNSN